MASLSMHVVKLATYGSLSLVSCDGAGIGLLMGAGLVAGSYVGSRIVNRVSERVFVLLVETTLVIAGLRFLIWG